MDRDTSDEDDFLGFLWNYVKVNNCVKDMCKHLGGGVLLYGGESVAVTHSWDLLSFPCSEFVSPGSEIVLLHVKIPPDWLEGYSDHLLGRVWELAPK